MVIGIGLVIWELQQSREATRSQLTSDSFQISAQLKAASLGDESAVALAKSCFSPEALTDAEYMILQNYYDVLIGSVSRTKYLSTGTFYDEDLWREIVAGRLMEMFVTTPGRGYWKTIAPHWVDPEIIAIGNSVLESMPPPQCAKDFTEWKSYVANTDDR